MNKSKLPVSGRDIMQTSVRDLLIARVATGKRLSLYGMNIPAAPFHGRTEADGPTDKFAVLVAVGREAEWVRDAVAHRVALSLAAGQGGTIKGLDYAEDVSMPAPPLPAELGKEGGTDA